MAQNQSPTHIEITETIEGIEECRPYTKQWNTHLHAYPPPGPQRTTRGRRDARSSPYSMSRQVRARAPSPDDLPKLLSTICLLVNCNIKDLHGHRTQEIQEKLGWTPRAEDVPSGTSTLTITPVAPEMEGMFENLCLKITTWKTPSQGQASDSGHANVSTLLDFRGRGTEDMRLALPNISGAKDSR
jgi:hypothetical protein